MKVYRSAMVLFLLALLTACGAPGVVQPATNAPAATQPPATQPPATQPPATHATDALPVITLRRSGGFTGKTLEWRIYADGRVEAQEGKTAPEIRQLPAQGVEELLAWLEQNKFFTASIPKPSRDEACCDRYVYEMTAVYKDKANTIQVVDSPEYLPPELADAFRRTAELLGVQF